ncbi:MAG: insulinase family protein [Lachnospiraceae bacterium]|nr:insulinase family protein [Lachnospiraceae bacterium]
MRLEELKAYEILEKRSINDLNSEGIVLRHKKTGARIALLSNDDDNKVFYIGFRTPPHNSTGVAHIVEHTVLCGSKEFPVKDPFIELAKGSLNTFLNAMTFPDKTVYPVASCNDKDFQNLMHVYLDAVFYPNIHNEKKIFEQEGWHYELESADDALTINGVVYSEMKGAFSSADDVLEREIMNSLFPDTAYGVESGGDPDVIPELSYEEFIAFHKSFYHPSNSYIYLYGDMDMAEKLQFIDEKYLSKFDALEIDSEIKKQKPFEQIKDIRIEYPISEAESEEGNAYLSYNTIVGDSLDKELYVAFQILDYAVSSAPGAPLKTALINKGIGKDVYSVYENGISQPYFSVIAKNTDADCKEAFVETIENVLKHLIANGIDKKALAAAIQYFEFKYREADFGSYPKGLMYGLQMFDSWLYDDKKVFWHIEANETFAALKAKIDTGFFEELLEKYILNNTHKSVVTAVPVKGLGDRKEAALAAKLAEYKDSLSEEEILAIVKETKALKEYQETPDTPEAMACIPLLTREDLRKEIVPLSNSLDDIDGTPFIRHDIFTNGIGYVRLVFRADNVSTDMLAYSGILKNVLGYMDTDKHTYGDLFNEIHLQTGGISGGFTLVEDVKQKGKYCVAFEMKTKVLYDNMQKGFDLLEEILLHTDITDEKRLYEIIAESKSRMQSQLMSSSHSVAAMRGASYFNECAALTDIMGGIPFYRLLEKIEKNFEEEKGTLIDTLQLLMKQLFRPENVLLGYTSPLDKEAGIRQAFRNFKANLYTEPVQKYDRVVPVVKRNEGFQTSAQVQYVCRAGDFSRNGLPYTGSLKVLRVIMGYDYLWNNVRVKGGAYGCMSAFRRNGSSYFVSYRDPNLGKTNEVYEKVVEYLENFEAGEREMTQFIIGTLSGEDTPLTPAAKGNRSFMAYMANIDEALLQRERDELLATTKEDIRGLAEYMKTFLEQNCICVIGNSNAIENEKQLFHHVEPLFH